MKYIIFISILFTTSNLFAQEVDGKPLSEIESQYIRLLDFKCYFAGDCQAKIDYGQKSILKNNKDRFIRDKSGELFNFNSPAHLLNIMYEIGYEVKEVFVTTDDGMIYLMEKITPSNK